ncbi:MAG: ribosome-associated translation inhibitor RaiA [Vicinamibacterales bacterium]
MRLELTGKGMDVTAGLRQLVNKRLARVERLLGRSMMSAQCVLSKQKYVHRADLTVHAAGDHVFHGVGEARSWSVAMTSAVEKVMKQSQTLKDKWKDRRHADSKHVTTRRRGATSGVPEPPSRDTPVREAPSRFPISREVSPPAAGPRVRRMRYPLKPMTVDEAAGLLQDNGEAFLVFRNAGTEAISVVFRRKDGNLGLIETEQ